MPQQLNLLELLERPTLDALAKPDQIYESEHWEFVVRQPENTRFERKSGKIDAKGLAVCLSAFGNGPAVEGGVVAVGIEKDGRVSGCGHLSLEKIAELESMGRDNCPTGRFLTKRLGVKNHDGEDDFVILARILFVEDRLVDLTDGSAYCRESDKCRRLTDVEKQEIRISKGERAFELEPCSLSFPDEFRIRDMTEFAKRIRASRDGSEDVTDFAIFESMRLGKVKDDRFLPNNVCVLMFAKDPQQVFPGAYIHFLRYDGAEEKSGKEYNVVKDRILNGTILDVIKNAAATIDANLREFTEFRSGKFYSVPEYPHDAWYELIVNACVHRSYHARTRPIFVKMFDNHFVVENPGGFMPSVTPDNLIHKPRNPFLMFVLREYGEVRCISEGTKRIVRELAEASLPEIIYNARQDTITAILRNNIANRSNSLDSEAYKVLGEAIAFSLDPDERKIVNFTIEHGRINVSDALRLMSTTYWHTAKAKLKRLVARGILDFVSTKVRDPNSHYVLKKTR